MVTGSSRPLRSYLDDDGGDLYGVAGIIIFREPLTPGILIGAVMIIGSGVYLGWQTGKQIRSKIENAESLPMNNIE
jgi:hypothetical protein